MTPPSSLSPEDQRLLDFRNTTNFRSVTRNDPSIIEIIETSVYSVIYHYDETAGAWEKQKQEGPMFIVGRDKSPEYALYMLNRQMVKNVTLPLVPGEMKLTVVDTATLQVARRGERLRRGVWFSEGTEAVERFRETILRICGEPTRRTAANQAGPSSQSASPASSPVPAAALGEDGLSRLFAGLVKPPMMPLVKISTTKPTASQDILPTTDTIPFIPVPKASSKSPPIPITAQASTSTPETSVPPPPQLPSPTIESPTAASPFPAGQTVDDLLMSIIGVTPAAPPQPPTAPIGQPSPRFPFQPAAPPAARPAPLASPEAAPPAPPHPETNSNIRSRPSKVRDATFAQAAANSSSSPLDDTMFVPLPADPPTQSMPSSSTSFPTPSIGPVLRFPASRSTPSRAVPPGTGRAPKASMLHQVNGNSTQTPRTAMISATTDTVASHSNGFSHRILGGPNEKLQKKEFVQSLLELIHTDQSFVDELWARYASLLGRAVP